MTYKLRQLTLRKGGESFVFRYSVGQETEVVGAFAELAANPESNFDWFDAAVLSYQIGRRVRSEISDCVEEE